MQRLQSWRRSGAWRAFCVGLLAVLWLPAGASATFFSSGIGVISPTDVITSLSFSPSATKTSFDPVTGVLHVEAYLVGINFSNRPNITGITANKIMLMSEIILVGGSFAVSQSAANNPRSTSATFANGLVDLSIFDTILGIPLMDTDYIGSLGFSATETGSVLAPLPIAGELTANLDVLVSGSDADFRSAFGTLGELDANFSGFFSDGASVVNNLCNLVKANVTVYGSGSPVCGSGGYALDDFDTNAVITIIPIPEPGTALLLGLGLAGVAALRRK
jgi:hypothetical protein